MKRLVLVEVPIHDQFGRTIGFQKLGMQWIDDDDDDDDDNNDSNITRKVKSVEKPAQNIVPKPTRSRPANPRTPKSYVRPAGLSRSEVLKKWWGEHPEARERISEINKGRKPGNAGHKGLFKPSNEWKWHMSEIRQGEGNSFFGRKHSRETIARIKAYWTPEHRAAMSEMKQHFYLSRKELPQSFVELAPAPQPQKVGGRKKGSKPWNAGKTGIYDRETLGKMSEAAKKRMGFKNPFFHKSHNEQTKKLLSEKAKARYQQRPELRRQLAERMRGKPGRVPSVAERARLSELAKKRFTDRPELRQRIGEAVQARWAHSERKRSKLLGPRYRKQCRMLYLCKLHSLRRETLRRSDTLAFFVLFY